MPGELVRACRLILLSQYEALRGMAAVNRQLLGGRRPLAVPDMVRLLDRSHLLFEELERFTRLVNSYKENGIYHGEPAIERVIARRLAWTGSVQQRVAVRLEEFHASLPRGVPVLRFDMTGRLV